MHTIGPIKKLGTIWWFEFFVPVDIQQVEEKLDHVMTEFENNYSRFKDDSLIGRLNTGQAIENPSSELLELMSIAQNIYKKTAGVFNVAVAQQLESSGYDADYSFQSRGTVQQVPNLNEVLKVSNSTIQILNAAKIDLGGFAKGYLIDKLAQIIENELGIKCFLINGGGDMYATSDNGKSITIGLADPQNPKKQVGSLQLLNQGFAASSPYLRSWTDQDGVEHNHLVGNKTPSSTYVVAPTATQADIWATTLAIDPAICAPKEVLCTIL